MYLGVHWSIQNIYTIHTEKRIPPPCLLSRFVLYFVVCSKLERVREQNRRELTQANRQMQNSLNDCQFRRTVPVLYTRHERALWRAERHPNSNRRVCKSGISRNL